MPHIQFWKSQACYRKGFKSWTGGFRWIGRHFVLEVNW